MKPLLIYFITLECNANEDCFGRSDTCTSGVCKCGDNDRCWGLYTCVLGQCTGMEIFVFNIYFTHLALIDSIKIITKILLKIASRSDQLLYFRRPMHWESRYMYLGRL